MNQAEGKSPSWSDSVEENLAVDFPPLPSVAKSGTKGNPSDKSQVASQSNPKAIKELIVAVTKRVDPATLPPPQHPWTDVVQGNKDEMYGWKLKYVPPGKESVVITTKHLEEGKRVWENALIGYILDGNPKFYEMANYVRKRWKGSQVPKVAMLQEGVFLFDFPSAEMKQVVLERIWFFNERPLILRPWTPDFNVKNLEVNKVPVWVKLHNLPLSLWTHDILQSVVIFIGNPIAIDKLTANTDMLTYARVLVDIEIKDQLPAASIPI